LSSKYFEASIKHVSALPEVHSANKQLFHTIDILDEAMSRNLAVRFKYCAYGSDGKLHAKLKDDGTPRNYIMDPYQLVATNGRYYLICRYRNSDELSYMRVDRMTDIEIDEEHKARPLRDIPGYEGGLDLPRHMAEQVYMFAGKPKRIKLRVKLAMINHVYDWFGDSVHFEDETEETVVVAFSANETAMLHWVMQFADDVEVLEPDSLRVALRELCKRQVKKYK
jgi:predicted DNA-binding transcriptional regulator YafY